jgi:hypothetical protein
LFQKEDAMATAKMIDVKGYCDKLYTELGGMKKRIDALREELAATEGKDSELFRTHDRHLMDVGEYVDWKLHILEKACPFDWKGEDEGVETVVSVRPAETVTGPDFSGGYVGG